MATPIRDFNVTVNITGNTVELKDVENRVIQLMARRVPKESPVEKKEQKQWVAIGSEGNDRVEVSVQSLREQLNLGKKLPKKSFELYHRLQLGAEEVFQRQRQEELKSAGIGITDLEAFILAEKIGKTLSRARLLQVESDSPRSSDSIVGAVSSTSSTAIEPLVESDPNIYEPKQSREKLKSLDSHSVRVFTGGETKVAIQLRDKYGSGAFKCVSGALYQVGQHYQRVAKLSTDLTKLSPKSVQRAKREGEFFLLLKDAPGIVRTHSVHYYETEKTRTVDGKDVVERKLKQAIYQELYEMSLYDLVNSQHLSETEIRSVVYQILTGLKSAHDLGIVHADLKPENILITHTGTGIKVGINDFGLSCLDGENQDGGTFEYLAPEAFIDRKNPIYSSKPADIWTVGCILYCLKHRDMFGHFKLLRSIYNHSKNGVSLEIDFKALVENMKFFTKEPEDKESLDHLLWRMTLIDPNQRATVDQALAFFAGGPEHILQVP